MIRGLLRCRRGVVSVEAAILLPVFLMVLVGAMEFGLMIFTYSALQTAVRDATRQIAVNFADPADVETAVAGALPLWSRDRLVVAVEQSAPADPATNVITVRASVPAEHATPVRLFSRATGEWSLQSAVAMKQELPL